MQPNYIPFNCVPYFGDEPEILREALRSGRLGGDGLFMRRVQGYFLNLFRCELALMTASCTAALEMCALLLDIALGDEVIMPSYTFSSTANAFVLRGARIRFVDIRPDTMNIDETKIEAAITDKTKVIVVVHYAGVACEMETILRVAELHGIPVVEDAAQGLQSSYQGEPLGTFGSLSTFSFHESKNITSGGEGGLLVINEKSYTNRAEIIRDKGTDRGRFIRGEVDKYTWVDLGSSFLGGELQAAHLWSQLNHSKEIYAQRMRIWDAYREQLSELELSNQIELPKIPINCRHNAHMFQIKCCDAEERRNLMAHLRKKGIETAFHYVPLHNSVAGIKFGDFVGEDRYTTSHSNRLLRLPLYFDLQLEEVSQITQEIKDWYLVSEAA